MDLLTGLGYLLLLGIPAASMASCLWTVIADALENGLGPALSEPRLSYALLGGVFYLSSGPCLGVAAGVLRPWLRRNEAWHVTLSLGLWLAAALLQTMLFAASANPPLGPAEAFFHLAPIIPVPIVLWLFARPQRVRQSIDPA